MTATVITDKARFHAFRSSAGSGTCSGPADLSADRSGPSRLDE
jgi:hypothetical protein